VDTERDLADRLNSPGYLPDRIEDRLAARDLEDLRKSGLSDEAIRAGVFYTEADSCEIRFLLKGASYAEAIGPALVIPYRDPDGRINGFVRLKPHSPRQDEEGKAIKYEAIPGRPPRAFFPPGTLGALANPQAPLILTEGEKKAAKGDQEGFFSIGLAGVWSWQKKRPRAEDGQPFGPRELIEDLKQIPWTGRQVFLVFDSDAAEKVNVRRAEWCLAQALKEQGAVVKVVRIAPGEDGAKVGLDDFLVAKGPKALQERMSSAQEPEQPAEDRGPQGHRTDWGNAQRLVREHGAHLRYCFSWGKWLVWDGNRWKLDESGEVMRRAKETVHEMYREASDNFQRLQGQLEALPKDDPNEKQLLLALKEAKADLDHALKSESLRRLESMVRLAESEPGVPIGHEELDKDPWLLNVRNGTIDLRTEEVRPPRREDLLTRRLDVDFDPEAKAPRWEEFLAQIMDKNPELIDFLCRAIGYTLTGSVKEQVLFFLHGSGANGKSTFLGTILHLLGDYGMQAPAELIMVRQGETHPTERADLCGRRMVYCIEVDQGRHMAESLVKQLTGGERIRARRMREDFWEFGPTHKLFLAGNHKPKIRGTDNGIWRRIHLIPFTVAIEEKDQDKDLPEKLRAELPGILAWAVRGCLEWQKQGLNPPKEVREATDRYRDEMDDLAAFLEENGVLGQGKKAQSTRLWKRYRDWSGGRGSLQNQKELKKALTDRGFTPKRSGPNGEVEFHGLALLSSD
jgi:putative DNA primase/helicase